MVSYKDLNTGNKSYPVTQSNDVGLCYLFFRAIFMNIK